MTDAEQALSDGVESLTQSFSSRSTFTIDGHDTVFAGVISQREGVSEQVAGGTSLVWQLVIVARRGQFTLAGVSIEPRMSIHHQGRRWVVVAAPYLQDDEAVVEFVCEPPQRGGGR